MKKIIIAILLITFLILSFVSCAKEAKGAAVSKFMIIVSKEAYVMPEKKELSPDEKKTVDKYYEEMISKYPQFRKIPREMLWENYSQSDENGNLSVSFVFCFGGITTGCSCTFYKNHIHPDGNWEIEENEFSKYYQKGLDENTVLNIKSSINNGILEYIETNHLDKSKLSDQNRGFYWQIRDGKIYACREEIADITDLTTKKYGCVDHAHIFAMVLLEMSGNSVKLTSLPVTGS